MKNCVICGVEFNSKGRSRAKTCGPACSRASNRLYCQQWYRVHAEEILAHARTEEVRALRRKDSYPSMCGGCGNLIQVKNPCYKFCSEQCREGAKRAEGIAKTMAARKARPPCDVCGGIIPLTRRSQALRCSEACWKSSPQEQRRLEKKSRHERAILTSIRELGLLAGVRS